MHLSIFTLMFFLMTEAEEDITAVSLCDLEREGDTDSVDMAGGDAVSHTCKLYVQVGSMTKLNYTGLVHCLIYEIILRLM